MREEVKNFPNESGIYKITSPTGKIYVGEAKDLKTRCGFYLTPNRIKKQRAIYNSLIKYSVNEHKIEILEFCGSEKLMERERFWQEHFNSVNDGLNCYLTPTDIKKKVLSKETKKIMSEKSKGINNHFYGKKHTEESILKISNNSKGQNNPNYGGKFKTDEWIQKQIISNSKKPLIIIDTLTEEVFKFINSKEVANFIGCSDSMVRESKRNGNKIKKRYLIKNEDNHK
jgi:group I intron endonuclease